MSDQAGDLWEWALPQHTGQLHVWVQRRLHRQPRPGRVPWWVGQQDALLAPDATPHTWNPDHFIGISAIVKIWGRVKNVLVLGVTQWLWLSTGFSTTLPLNSSFANRITESLIWNFFLSCFFKPLVFWISFCVFICPLSLELDYLPIFLGAYRVTTLSRPMRSCPLTEFLVLFPSDVILSLLLLFPAFSSRSSSPRVKCYILFGFFI